MTDRPKFEDRDADIVRMAAGMIGGKQGHNRDARELQRIATKIELAQKRDAAPGTTWRVEYDNDTGPSDEGFTEWWTVTDGDRSFKANSEVDASFLVSALAPVAPAPIARTTTRAADVYTGYRRRDVEVAAINSGLPPGTPYDALCRFARMLDEMQPAVAWRFKATPMQDEPWQATTRHQDTFGASQVEPLAVTPPRVLTRG